jgi:hypothetical protein
MVHNVRSMSNRAWQEQAAARSSQRRSVDASTHYSSRRLFDWNAETH